MINPIISFFIESIGLCSVNETTNDKSLLLITFGSGPDQYSDKTPSSFNFNTNYRQKFNVEISHDTFAFVNAVPELGKFFVYDWYKGAQDHTENDTDGYMYLVSVGDISQLFQSTVNNLCIGVCYEFSVYLMNPVKEAFSNTLLKPDIRLEVRTATNENELLAQFSTGDILDYDKMAWSKHSLLFTATSSSVVLLMITNVGPGNGNDLAIDDIELRVCSTNHSIVYPPG